MNDGTSFRRLARDVAISNRCSGVGGDEHAIRRSSNQPRLPPKYGRRRDARWEEYIRRTPAPMVSTGYARRCSAEQTRTF
jgi:hypothetical protein